MGRQPGQVLRGVPARGWGLAAVRRTAGGPCTCRTLGASGEHTCLDQEHFGGAERVIGSPEQTSRRSLGTEVAILTPLGEQLVGRRVLVRDQRARLCVGMGSRLPLQAGPPRRAMVAGGQDNLPCAARRCHRLGWLL